MGSVFKLFSLGTVAENKPRFNPQDPITSSMVNVLDIEHSGGTDGEVTFNPTQVEAQGTDSSGEAYAVKGTADATLPCYWLPHAGNRISPPDVRRGEMVEIWRNADTDDYYWRPLERTQDLQLRTQETMILCFGATDDPGGHGMDFSKCYMLEVSTHEGLITFQTSKALLEPFAYTIQLNTREGYLCFTDDIETQVLLNSRQRQVRMSNADGSFAEIIKRMINMNAADGVHMESGGSKFDLTPAGTSLITPALAIKKG